MTENTTKEADEIALQWWTPIWEFLIHAVVGTTLFLLIAVPAIGLDLIIKLLQTKLTLSPLIILSLSAIEYLILCSDLLLFVIFIVRSASRTIKLL